jgi:hypothetical protein
MKLHLPTSVRPILLAGALCCLSAFGAARVHAASVTRLEVRVVTGSQELTAGSFLELRIYEAGKTVRHLPLVHGDSWLPDSTHIIPVKLNEPLDPRSVVRFGIYYRSAGSAATGLEILAADVELPSNNASPERLLDTTLSGVIARQGELATTDGDQAALVCVTDADCDDKRACNGRERCDPRSRQADARGCVKGTPVVCPVNQVCGEGVGCKGAVVFAPAATSTPAEPNAVATPSAATTSSAAATPSAPGDSKP